MQIKDESTHDKQLMHLAIEIAKTGNSRFGCVIAEKQEVIVKAFNTIKTGSDPTAHAEINAIRKLAEIPDCQDKKLTLYTTGEPCPMCMTAIMYAGIDRVVFGLSISEISKFMKQIKINAQEIVDKGFKKVEITGGVLHEECLNLFQTQYYDKR